MITAKEAGVKLGITSSRVRMLISTGALPAVRVPSLTPHSPKFTWMIKESHVAAFKPKPKGRPRGRRLTAEEAEELATVIAGRLLATVAEKP